MPSQPHTGFSSFVQPFAIALHVPVAPAAPHFASGGKLQYWLFAQLFPFKPPQTLPPPEQPRSVHTTLPSAWHVHLLQPSLEANVSPAA
jgi:hypothetical protein